MDGRKRIKPKTDCLTYNRVKEVRTQWLGPSGVVISESIATSRPADKSDLQPQKTTISSNGDLTDVFRVQVDSQGYGMLEVSND
jgi:hypothetical protein